MLSGKTLSSKSKVWEYLSRSFRLFKSKVKFVFHSENHRGIHADQDME